MYRYVISVILLLALILAKIFLKEDKKITQNKESQGIWMLAKKDTFAYVFRHTINIVLMRFLWFFGKEWCKENICWCSIICYSDTRNKQSISSRNLSIRLWIELSKHYKFKSLWFNKDRWYSTNFNRTYCSDCFCIVRMR